MEPNIFMKSQHEFSLPFEGQFRAILFFNPPKFLSHFSLELEGRREIL